MGDKRMLGLSGSQPTKTERHIASARFPLLSFRLRAQRSKCGVLSGAFFFQLFLNNALATPAEEKPVQQYGEDQPRRVTRSSAMDIQGCRNKNRPNGTCSIADHGLSIGGAVLVAQDKQTLPGKPWMTPAMVWPLQPDGAFAQIRPFNQPLFSVPRNGS
jgi:hypothetical protein